MEYDKRIMNTDMILTCFDINFANKYGYKNRSGYFTNCIDSYADLDKCRYGKLTDISDDTEIGYIPYQVDSDRYYGFFLPESATEPEKKEKKYRPFTLMEFTEKFPIGLPIKFRKKGEKKDEWFSVLTGYWNHQVKDEVITYIIIGTVQYTLQELFNDYEWQMHYTEDFEPFGVEE